MNITEPKSLFHVQYTRTSTRTIFYCTIFIPREAVSKFNAIDVELETDRDEHLGLRSICGHGGRVVVIITIETKKRHWQWQ